MVSKRDVVLVVDPWSMRVTPRFTHGERAERGRRHFFEDRFAVNNAPIKLSDAYVHNLRTGTV